MVEKSTPIKDPSLIKHIFRREDELYCLSLTNGVITASRTPLTLTNHISRLDLLLESSNKIACLKATDGTFLIYNTLTGDSFVVDDAPARRHSSCWLGYGFGYDPHDDDYKILVDFPKKRLSLLKPEERKFHAECKYRLLYVYSLRSREWKSFEAGLPPVASDWNEWDTRKRSYCFNGVLHWVVCRKSNLSHKVVATLDLHTLTFSAIGLPIAGRFKILDPPVRLSELDGQLCCSVYTATFDVWVMKEYGVHESWTKLITINRLRITREYSSVQETSGFGAWIYGYKMQSCVIRRCRGDGKFVIYFCHGVMVKVFEFDVNKDRIVVLYENNWRRGRSLRWWKRCFRECFGKSRRVQ